MPSPLGAFYRSPLGAFLRSPLGARGDGTPGAGGTSYGETFTDFFRFRDIRATLERYKSTTGPTGTFTLDETVTATTNPTFMKQGAAALLSIWGGIEDFGGASKWIGFISQYNFGALSEDDTASSAAPGTTTGDPGTPAAGGGSHDWRWVPRTVSPANIGYGSGADPASEDVWIPKTIFQGAYADLDISEAGGLVTIVGTSDPSNQQFQTVGYTLSSPQAVALIISNTSSTIPVALLAAVELDTPFSDIHGDWWRVDVTFEIDVELNT